MTDRITEEDLLLLPENMVRLYAGGAFPMADEENNIDWYYPQIRTVIPLADFNIPRSLKKFMKSSEYTFTFDECTIDVVEACAERKETWISEKLKRAYRNLLEAGFLHSVEVWEENYLIGGLYGVSVNGVFFGESMFSRKSQASKTALVKLIAHLNSKQFTLLDVQYMTEHLRMFGAKEISLEDYDTLRIKGLTIETSF